MMSLLALAAIFPLIVMSYYFSLLWGRGSTGNHRAVTKKQVASGRLFFDQSPADIGAKIEGDMQLLGVFQWVEGEARAMLSSPLPAIGPRGLPKAEDAPRILRRILYLSFVYLVRRDKAYLDKALGDMRIVSLYRSWNPSNHLATSVISAALAIGYNWLYSDLPPLTGR